MDTFTQDVEDRLHCSRCEHITDHTSFSYLPSDGKNLLIKLDRVSFADGEVCKNSSNISIQEEVVTRICMGNTQRLKLTSFLIHHGSSPVSGHWTAVVRGDSGQWIKLDDVGGNKWYLTAHDAGLPKSSLLVYNCEPMQEIKDSRLQSSADKNVMKVPGFIILVPIQ
jgi:hypothetical protein